MDQWMQARRIPLGAGRWIEDPKWPSDADGGEAMDVDQEIGLSQWESLWSALETRCDSGCCFTDAFDFSPHSIRNAVPPGVRARAAADLRSIRDAAMRVGHSYIFSRRLNAYLTRDTLVQLLQHICEVLESSAQPNT